MSRKHPRLAQRARNQGRRATGPDRRATRRSIQHTRQTAQRATSRARRQGASAARSAINTTQNQAGFERGLGKNLSGVATKGLVRRQLQAGAASVERYGQGLASISRRAAKQDIRGIRQSANEDIYQARESIHGAEHQATVSALTDLIQAKRQRQQDAIDQQTQDALGRIQDQRKRQRGRAQDAYGAVGSLLETDPTPPKNDKEWGQFSQALYAQNPLINPRVLDDAVNRYRAKQNHHVLSYWLNLFRSLGS
jgi:hypothetical protein